MALLQAVLSDPNQKVVTYPTLRAEDDTDGKISKENVFQKIRKNWRQILNILPGKNLIYLFFKCSFYLNLFEIKKKLQPFCYCGQQAAKYYGKYVR